MKTMGVAKRWLPVMALLALTAGCGTRHVSRDISPQGQASQVVFPEIRQGGWMQEGTFPNLDNLRRVAPGVSKDQLYALLGAPHFREGLFGVREWDYIFNFRTGNGAEYVTCQYKVIFDRDYLARSFHWKGQDCERWLATVPVAAAAVVAAPTRTVTLSADALFAFAKHGVGDIKDDGRREVAELGRELAGGGMEAGQILVVGHTDRIGSDASNLLLSQRRAETVRQVLIEGGVPADRIRAVGHGESQPVKHCEESLPRAQEIACLQPNRRVEIVVSGSVAGG